jgi:type VI protein secretion system component Hcp
MIKRDEKLQQTSPTRIESVELSDEQLQDVSGGSITRKTDAASPVFFQNCCAGEHYSK